MTEAILFAMGVIQALALFIALDMRERIVRLENYVFRSAKHD